MNRELIEVMARGINNVNPIGCSPEEAAQAVIQAAESAGYALVPVERLTQVIDSLEPSHRRWIKRDDTKKALLAMLAEAAKQ